MKRLFHLNCTNVIGRKIITIKKSMVPFAMERQLFGTRYKTLDSRFEGKIEL